MSYITKVCSPYRDNVWKECMEILTEDSEYVCSSFEDKDLFFLMAYISVMFVSILKTINFAFNQMKKPKMDYKHLDLKSDMQAESIAGILSQRESIGLRNTDNLNPQPKVKAERTNSITSLRNYLYQHNLTLRATIIKKINHKVTEEELLEMYRLGEITKPLSTTHVTFGENINKLLKEIFGDTVDLRTDRFNKSTYIKILNDDFYPLKEALNNFYNENIKIIFDNNTKN